MWKQHAETFAQLRDTIAAPWWWWHYQGRGWVCFTFIWRIVFCFQRVCKQRCGQITNYVHVLDDLWLSPVGFMLSHQLVLATSALHRLQVSILCMHICHVR